MEYKIQMKTFSCGNITINEHDFDNAIAIYNEIQRLINKQEHEKYITKHNHGHRFGHNGKCEKCGILLSDYQMLLYNKKANICYKVDTKR